MINDFNKRAYLTEGEVATRLSVSMKWLQKMRYAGEGIPYAKFNGAIRYPIAEILRFEAASMRLSSSHGGDMHARSHDQSNSRQSS